MFYLFFKIKWFSYVGVLHVRLYTVCAALVKARKRGWILWSRHYRWLWAAIWVLGTKPGSSGKVALNCWAISPGPGPWTSNLPASISCACLYLLNAGSFSYDEEWARCGGWHTNSGSTFYATRFKNQTTLTQYCTWSSVWTSTPGCNHLTTSLSQLRPPLNFP